jgi:hypothetical protein
MNGFLKIHFPFSFSRSPKIKWGLAPVAPKDAPPLEKGDLKLVALKVSWLHLRKTNLF